MEELERDCDRVVIMREGIVVGELLHEDITEENIIHTISEAHTNLSLIHISRTEGNIQQAGSKGQKISIAAFFAADIIEIQKERGKLCH